MTITVGVTARALELNLMEYITALLCWCERVEAHPGYSALARCKPALAPNVSGAADLALRRRAELMIRSRTSGEELEEEVKRLKEMMVFLKGLWQALEHPPSHTEASFNQRFN